MSDFDDIPRPVLEALMEFLKGVDVILTTLPTKPYLLDCHEFGAKWYFHHIPKKETVVVKYEDQPISGRRVYNFKCRDNAKLYIMIRARLVELGAQGED